MVSVQYGAMSEVQNTPISEICQRAKVLEFKRFRRSLVLDNSV